MSIMTVNNEIGVLQPVQEIGRLCKSRKVVPTYLSSYNKFVLKSKTISIQLNYVDTYSRLISEVKQHRAELVLGWVTT